MTTPNLYQLPESSEAITKLQSERKRLAVQRAMRAPFFKKRLSDIDLNKLDDPDEWQKIPILDKEELRNIPEADFLTEFCIAPKREISEYWRSGGSTGRPLFYPRTFEDIRHAMASFARSYIFAGIDRGESVHNSFPLGIHPAGQMWARAAATKEIGVAWAGAGTGTPSELQLALIKSLQPTVWMGLPSYGLHLLSLAESSDQLPALQQNSVSKMIVSAEPMSEVKRERLESGWGAKVYNCFGMTECCLLGAESDSQQGFHFWSDLAYAEVLDEHSLQPVAEGETGLLVVTPLFTNNATPFLRWNSGDLVTWQSASDDGSDFSQFPRLRHARRTKGFFKVRGININHADFEDFIELQSGISEFKLLAGSDNRGVDELVLHVDPATGVNTESLVQQLVERVAVKFELTCRVQLCEPGELGREYQTTVKPLRFVDQR